ncbi:hypothetical protein IVB18_18760 [Bradyrhizobium sp. 186]|uniref:hypothetical protein n=1 Tax=Bradyrhizobium sp. 186 TaxID=2782654 RepID=UPI002000B407|nr:hypothetical protein [Bradyrhizobium sp. 186]UPK39092.1 hypothetical protein IVB18_18760 [Bradyrhizobium sp. 186]
MADAIQSIVNGYVFLNDRKALDDLLVQRRKLVETLNACAGIDCTGTIRQVEEDITVIEAGLARLDG